MNELKQYGNLLNDIKNRIRHAQAKAVFSANAEMIQMYFDIGKMILEKQQNEGWGSAVIPQLAKDIRNELPEQKGFSERNIGYMIRFAREYSINPILQQPVAKLPDNHLLWKVPWGHHALLMEKIKDQSIRIWYMEQTIQNGWSRDILGLMIKSNAHHRQGKLVSNFEVTLPKPQSDLATQSLKDPYIFDFLTLTEPFQERELETELVKHLEKFLIELGAGFAFMGRQYPLTVSDKDFYLDLLFYHVKLRSFVIIELKKVEFKPEYAGKMNFYCSAVDDSLKHDTDQPTIGLILCQTKNKIFAEYALRDIHKPIGISDYELTCTLPETFKSCLPSVEEIEAELSRENNK
ncbi:MAG: PDDEXK nuclease domain-containing protein [Candidatus Aminicenantes bacterium]|nr:PDDEXK nuclease domain-containing protein [Candidatus Aminicenantes bacterium]